MCSDRGRRQVKICGVDRHSERGAPAYNGDLEAEQPPSPSPCKNSWDLERPLAKVGWTCPPRDDATGSDSSSVQFMCCEQALILSATDQHRCARRSRMAKAGKDAHYSFVRREPSALG